MARRGELLRFARAHKLKIGTIADLISYRLAKEESVELIAEHVVPTDHGEFVLKCFEDHVHRSLHLALVHGEPKPDRPTLVRVHVQDTLSDVLGVRWQSLGWPLREAMGRVAQEDAGVVIILRGHDDARRIVETLARGGTDRETGSDAQDLRTYGIGAQILRKLNVRKMRVLSAPKIMHAISGFGLEVVEYLDDESDAQDRS